MELTLFAPQGPPGWDANHQLDAPAWEKLWFLPREATEQAAHSSKVSSQARAAPAGLENWPPSLSPKVTPTGGPPQTLRYSLW